MEKTTVYLPSELKRALERAARLEGKSEAELIREGVAVVVEPHRVAEPILPLFTLDERHFRAVLGPGGRPFRILPADVTAA